MISLEGLVIFAATTGLVCFTPGPAALLVASSSASHGKKHIPAAVMGICLANVVFFGLSAAGVSSLLAASPKLFSVMRIAGAIYLMYLGFQLIRAKPQSFGATRDSTKEAGLMKTFGKAFAVEASNPKAILYFGALLPQSIVPSEPLVPQLAIFCLVTFVLDVFAYSFYGVMGLGLAKVSQGGIFTALTRSAGIAFLISGVRLARG